jgi:adenylate cyclase
LERKLAAILCADVYGYSRLMGEDEEATLRTLSAHRKIVDSSIEQHHGRFVNSAGDSVLAEFASVVNAVQCAVDVQNMLTTENANLPSDRRMEFRIGVNLGDVMVEGEQIYGDGVNVGARLESLAEPGGICISGTVHDQIRDKLALGYEDRGEQTVKNIARPVHVWRIRFVSSSSQPMPAPPRVRSNYWRGGVFSLAGLAIIVVTILLVQHVSLKTPHTNASIPPQEKRALPLPTIPSIAVLPFTNLSGDVQQEYFSDGIADQLISELSRVPGLFVIAHNSSFVYKGKTTSEQEIGKELGVRYVLEGSIRKAADQVRIAVELVDAASGSEAWTARYDRPFNDIFQMQDEIVGKVVATLGLLFKLDEMKTPHGASFRPTENLESYDDFLRGVEYHFRFSKDDNEKSMLWCKKAVALDPRFSEAYALAGWDYWLKVWNQWSTNPQDDMAHSIEMVHKALAVDDSSSVALALLSYVDWLQDHYDQAVADAKRAVAINPNSANGYQALSDALANASEPEEALRAAEKAMRLDPAHADVYAYCAEIAYNEMGRYQEAVASFKRNVASYPNNLVAHLAIITSYVELGREQDARTEVGEVKRISPGFTLASVHAGKSAALNEIYLRDLRKAGLQ